MDVEKTIEFILENQKKHDERWEKRRAEEEKSWAEQKERWAKQDALWAKNEERWRKSDARWEKRWQKAEARMAQFDKRLEATRRVVELGMRLMVRIEQRHTKLSAEVRALTKSFNRNYNGRNGRKDRNVH